MSRLSWGYRSKKLPGGAAMPFTKPIELSEEERRQIQVFLTSDTALCTEQLYPLSEEVQNRKGERKTKYNC